MSNKLKITSILFLLLSLSSCSKDEDATKEIQNNDPELSINLSNGNFDDFYQFENSTFEIQNTTSYIGSLESKNNSNSSTNTIRFSLVITDLSQLKKGNTINYNVVELFININDINYRGTSGKLVVNKFRKAENSVNSNTFILDGTFEFNALSDDSSDSTDVTGSLQNITLVCDVCQ
ncbi:hypothetical protein EYD45_05815 [Hyunsoonleella flava]|uniref:Uncharacterized protein n=1 Tax=Hyunsoonleella flava TaxID=2527939 RepID=A0A4Q9FFG4_9FLAO|nr:hypothetical protein [Hyunsoonleella flava]TBN04776.1 hypothetical protein EYD45_05815 [Hyunsoonleella flava]